MNHIMLAPSLEQNMQLNEEAKQLFTRVKLQTDDVELSKQAMPLKVVAIYY